MGQTATEQDAMGQTATEQSDTELSSTEQDAAGQPNKSAIDTVKDAISNIFTDSDDNINETTSTDTSTPDTPTPVDTSASYTQDTISPASESISAPTSEDDIQQIGTPEIGTLESEAGQLNESAELKENNFKSTDIIYLLFNDTKITENTEELDNIRQSIAQEVKEELDKLLDTSSKETINVYRVRFGPVTTSVEVVINITGEEKLKEDDIKNIIVNNILRNTLVKKIFITNLDLLKEIYFDGISKYSDIKSKPAKYKRLMFEIPGIYPITGQERITFEENVIETIKEILGYSELEIERIHLERIARVTNKNRVIVQFLLMDGDESSIHSNKLLMEFKDKYFKNKNEYFNNYQVKNIVFGEPSIILDVNDIDIDNSVSSQMKSIEKIDKITLKNLENEYEQKYDRKAYYGCELTLEDLKNNIITSSTPLFSECEQNIHDYLNGVN